MTKQNSPDDPSGAANSHAAGASEQADEHQPEQGWIDLGDDRNGVDEDEDILPYWLYPD